MSCCGKRRKQISFGNHVSGSHLQESGPNTDGAVLRYMGKDSILVKGRHSGGSYFFSASQPEQRVRGGDLSSLLSTGLFQNADRA